MFHFVFLCKQGIYIPTLKPTRTFSTTPGTQTIYIYSGKKESILFQHVFSQG
jgi:hypothetical protein